MSAKPTIEAVREIYRTPLLELVYRAAGVHRAHHAPDEVQRCTLLSVKTGGCPEDCSYCPQAARYHTDVKAARLLDVDEVRKAAHAAAAGGSTRFCMGAAWREVRDGGDFDRVLTMVREVADTGMEVCCTLGMLKPHQAEKLREAGLTAYNHNLDTSPEFYGEVIGTRTYDDRLDTIEAVSDAGISVCCGGIVGLGESDEDRIGLLHRLVSLDPVPESVPVNALVRVEGTPLADADPVDPLVVVRTIATARILMPEARVRLSAGRKELGETGQALAFLAGANSIFAGDQLLTTPNPSFNEDDALFERLGLKILPAEDAGGSAACAADTEPATNPASA
ncbi:MAG: biotin synthase BioB [Gemmatimonadetes bacterium]|nr:biotin synthase BioB [Gemmatimonadota bacterium]